MKTDFKSTVKCKREKAIPRYEIGSFIPAAFTSLSSYFYLKKYDYDDDMYLVLYFDECLSFFSSGYCAEEHLTKNISERKFTKEEQINLMFAKNKIDLTWEA